MQPTAVYNLKLNMMSGKTLTRAVAFALHRDSCTLCPMRYMRSCLPQIQAPSIAQPMQLFCGSSTWVHEELPAC